MVKNYVSVEDVQEFFNNLEDEQKAKIGLNQAIIKMNPLKDNEKATLAYLEQSGDVKDPLQLLPNKDMLDRITTEAKEFMVGVTGFVMQSSPEMIARALNDKRLSINLDNPVVIANTMDTQIKGKYVGENKDYLIFKSLVSDVKEAKGHNITENPQMLLSKDLVGMKQIEDLGLTPNSLYHIEVKDKRVEKAEKLNISLSKNEENTRKNDSGLGR
jgi:hypothetical protein